MSQQNFPSLIVNPPSVLIAEIEAAIVDKCARREKGLEVMFEPLPDLPDVSEECADRRQKFWEECREIEKLSGEFEDGLDYLMRKYNAGPLKVEYTMPSGSRRTVTMNGTEDSAYEHLTVDEIREIARRRNKVFQGLDDLIKCIPGLSNISFEGTDGFGPFSAKYESSALLNK